MWWLTGDRGGRGEPPPEAKKIIIKNRHAVVLQNTKNENKVFLQNFVRKKIILGTPLRNYRTRNKYRFNIKELLPACRYTQKMPYHHPPATLTSSLNSYFLKELPLLA